MVEPQEKVTERAFNVCKYLKGGAKRLSGAQKQENEKQWVKTRTQKGAPENEEDYFEDVRALEQIAQRFCGVSSSENIQKPSEHNSE